MESKQQSGEELVNLAISLASYIKEEDLNDPSVYALCSQLIQLLDPKPQPLPQEAVNQLAQIPNKSDRFRAATEMFGVQDPEQFEQLANSMKSAGLFKSFDYKNTHILMYPVSINGKTQPDDAEMPSFHMTLKVLGNSPQSSKNEIKTTIEKHKLETPKDIKIKPHVFDSKTGKHHVLLIEGIDEKLKSAHAALENHGAKDSYPFIPHITVDKEIHDQIKSSNLTAKDLDIKIHPLEYRIGNETVHVFHSPKATVDDYGIKTKLGKLSSGIKDLKGKK